MASTFSEALDFILISDGHAYDLPLNCSKYCTEMSCPPPHTTHFLQPLDRTIFKPFKTCAVIKRQQTSCTSILMLQSQNLLRENFSPWLEKKAERLGSLSEFLSEQTYILLHPPLSPKTNLCRLRTFHKIQPNSCHQALLIRSDPKNHKPSRLPFLQSTSDSQ